MSDTVQLAVALPPVRFIEHAEGHEIVDLSSARSQIVKKMLAFSNELCDLANEAGVDLALILLREGEGTFDTIFSNNATLMGGGRVGT